MPSRNYEIIKVFSLSLLFISLPLTIFALTLQQDYPQIVGVDLTPDTTLHQLATYIYYFFVIIGGVVAFWGLITGGFQWLTSEGDSQRLSEAKKQVLASFLGLLLLLSSWVILHTLDPSLVTFHAFAPSIQEETIPVELPAMGVTQLSDGIVIYTSHPYFRAIPFPEAILLQVEETTNFPKGGGTINLGGPVNEPANNRYCPTEVEFLNPTLYDEISCQRDPNTGNIILDFDNPPRCCLRDRQGNPNRNFCCQVDPHTGEKILGTCPTRYYYGVICFSEKNGEGLARVITSYRNSRHTLLGLFRDQGLPGRGCCQSLYAFKQPAVSIYSQGDQILFYENYFPIKKDLETGQVIGGACIKIDKDNAPEDCALPVIDILDQDYEAQEGIFRIENLCGQTQDDNGNVIRNWYPLSMKVKADRDKKYLIVLFQGGGGGNCPRNGRPFTGNAYMVHWDVQDFSDSKDDRLWWAREGLEPFEPRSAQILPVEPIE